ncbi:hypothetical protein BJ508DRAFT_77975 [Ascobolus immersus RN42]|uniref:PAN2-PAN3 deadenylation complex subunit PAN3 n=1 Tax=Ascobolus immersus RN42 TaxID=1160509 RepID=A0A3N4IAD3_ASCIM|nr:hypothetical protein BJ508DRAFT_77975 [Ascobolus immersus RN42]
MAQTQTVNPYEYTNLGNQVQINPYVHTANDMFYQQQSNFPQPLQYHLYAPRGPERTKLDPHQRTIHGLFLPDNLREELQKKNEATLQSVPNIALPVVDVYHSLVPLDMTVNKSSSAFGFPSSVYKAWSNKDGKPYVLRRIEGFRLANEKHIMNVQRWKKILSGSIVTVHDAFTTTRFGDSSIIFVYDYHPCARTLHDEHFGGQSTRHLSQRNNHHQNASEAQIWNYMVQISTALKTIHAAGLAARLIDATKILITGKGRIRLNACSILDVLAPDQHASMLEYQLEDIHSLGRLVLSLACGGTGVLQNPKKGLEHVQRQYSAEFRAALNYLIVVPEQGQMKTIDEFISQYAYSHFAQSLDSAQLANDELESHLSRELENGRLVRLLTKINFIIERPEYEDQRAWSETGERYLLKLFRDYVFHSVDEHGHPAVDMAHVLACINKLDAGSDEKVMLVSRDEQNCFVASYKELKRHVDNAFNELCKPSSLALRR